MLKSIPIQIISELHKTGIKHTEPASFTRFPCFEYFEKINPRDVILSNSSLQVLVAMAYHNDYYSGCHVPVSMQFTTPMPPIEFVSLPTIQLFPNIFKIVRVFTRDNLISGIWTKELTKETIKAYETLTEESNIDNCLTTLFRTNNARIQLYEDTYENADVYEFEWNSEQDKLDVKEPSVFKNKFFMYLLSELSRNGNTVGGSPLQGWSKDELDSCEYFYELKKIFKRVFVAGRGEPWKSTHLFVSEPVDFTNLLIGSPLSHGHVIGYGYS
ncbi:conserved hypothetical protein [Candidatus Desulfosporosinus infrequens]|uniref:Uncharacterized protein n=1 Tax=Candidatus Desulfosporosinus infrequens TaxID=2043169 RepID=A0A2U3LTR2_9FIRM|nr:conserved hypothetical protein [Candidatus Desulfosporosinus infrequens]